MSVRKRSAGAVSPPRASSPKQHTLAAKPRVSAAPSSYVRESKATAPHPAKARGSPLAKVTPHEPVAKAGGPGLIAGAGLTAAAGNNGMEAPVPNSKRYVNVGTGAGPPSAAAWKQEAAKPKARPRYTQVLVTGSGELESAMPTMSTLIDLSAASPFSDEGLGASLQLNPDEENSLESGGQTVNSHAHQAQFVNGSDREQRDVNEILSLPTQQLSAVEPGRVQSSPSPASDGTVSPGFDSGVKNADVDIEAICIENRRLREELERQRLQIMQLTTSGNEMETSGVHGSASEHEEGKRPVASILKKSCKTGAPLVKLSSAPSSPRKDLQEGCRVEAFFKGEWYLGSLMSEMKTDENGVNWWIVQCDSDTNGELTYAQSVRMLREESSSQVDSSVAAVGTDALSASVPGSPMGGRLRAPPRASVASSGSSPPWALERLKQSGNSPQVSPRDAQQPSMSSGARSVPTPGSPTSLPSATRVTPAAPWSNVVTTHSPSQSPRTAVQGTMPSVGSIGNISPRSSLRRISMQAGGQSVPCPGRPLVFFPARALTPPQSPKPTTVKASVHAVPAASVSSHVTSGGAGSYVAPVLVSQAHLSHTTSSPQVAHRSSSSTGAQSVPVRGMMSSQCFSAGMRDQTGQASFSPQASPRSFSPQLTPRNATRVATTMSSAAIGQQMGYSMAGVGNSTPALRHWEIAPAPCAMGDGNVNANRSAAQLSAQPLVAPQATSKNVQQQAYPAAGLTCGLVSPRPGARQPQQTSMPNIGGCIGSSVPNIFGPTASIMQCQAQHISSPATAAYGAPPHAGLPPQLGTQNDRHWPTNPALSLTPGPCSTAAGGFGSSGQNGRMFHFKPGGSAERSASSHRRISLPGWENATGTDMFSL